MLWEPLTGALTPGVGRLWGEGREPLVVREAGASISVPLTGHAVRACALVNHLTCRSLYTCPLCISSQRGHLVSQSMHRCYWSPLCQASSHAKT